jgi:phosphoenolpyruvate carboxykinase (ATP)
MPRDAVGYATMLVERLAHAPTHCWLVNTGWSGGAYGVGKRMPISLTRNLLKGALSGSLEHTQMTPHPVFRVLVPEHCPRVPPRFLDPRSTWVDGKAYDRAAAALAQHFAANFAQFQGRVPPEVAAAGPRLDQGG